MSKDKGTKNHKKAPADKSLGKGKILSSYKTEGKSLDKQASNEALVSKPAAKPGKS